MIHYFYLLVNSNLRDGNIGKIWVILRKRTNRMEKIIVRGDSPTPQLKPS